MVVSQLLEIVEEGGRRGVWKSVSRFFTSKAVSSRTAAKFRDRLGLDPTHPQVRETMERGVSDAANEAEVSPTLLSAFVKEPRNRMALVQSVVKPNSDFRCSDEMTLGVVERKAIKKFIEILPASIEKAKAATYSAEGQELLNKQDQFRDEVRQAHTFRFRSWMEWAGSGHHQIPLAAPEATQLQIQSIRDRFGEPQAVLRIVGLSGLGKTRLALEAFRPPTKEADDPEQAKLSALVHYEPNGSFPNVRLVKGVEELVSGAGNAIVVVDNCDIKLHDQLEEVVNRTQSRVRLLTLDYDLSRGRVGDTEVVELSPDTQAPVVGVMLRESGRAGDFSESDLQRAERFAQGYPEIARLILEAWEAGRGVGDALTDDVLIGRLLFGRSAHDDDARRVLSGLALFSHFGYKTDPARMRRRDDDPARQFEYIAENVCGSTVEKVYEICASFRRRGILEEHGQFMRVRPRPLAIRLAAEWWERTHPDRVQEVITTAAEVDLTEVLCRQMEHLGEVTQAREIVERLCAPDAPFGQAEILGSSTGSRIVRSFAVVHPGAAMRALDHAFGDKSSDELRQIREGRRDLVNTLEDLAWEPETFPTAARLLMYFAAAENEGWANNATGQFLQLFHLLLSGTKVPALDRVEVLERGLESEDQPRREVAVRGLGSALTTGHFSRSGGSEGRGGVRSREDWRPSTYKEQFSYLLRCLELLTEIACGDSPQASLAQEELQKKIGSLLTMGNTRLQAKEAVRRVADSLGGTWTAGIAEVARLLSGNRDDMPDDVRSQLRLLMDDLQPTEIVDRVRQIASAPPFFATHERDEHGQWVDRGLEQALELADEIAQSQPDWNELLSVVNAGKQTYTVPFGRRISERLDDPSQLIERTVEHLSTLPQGQANWGFVSGLVDALALSEQEMILEHVKERDDVRYGYIFLVQVSGLSKTRLEAISAMVRNGTYGKDEVERLRYALTKVDKDDLVNFARSVLRERADLGPTLLEITESYAREHGGAGLQQIEREIILSDLLVRTYQQGWQRLYSWREAVNRILTEETDSELANAVADQIVDLTSTAVAATAVGLGDALRDIVRVLLCKYFEVTWSKFSAQLLSGGIESLAMMDVVAQNPFGSFDSSSTGVLFEEVSADTLIGWANVNSPRAPLILARVAPIFSQSEINSSAGGEEPRQEVVEWHPITSALINNFYGVEGFLEEIGANLFSFGSAGSRIPYYERRITLLMSLLDHEALRVRRWADREIERFRAYIRDEVEEAKEERLRYGE